MITASEPALRCVRARVASITEKAADMMTIRKDRMKTAAGASPRSTLKARIPSVQKMTIWTSPRITVPVKTPPRMDSRRTEVASRRSSVRFWRSRTMASAATAAAKKTNITR